MPGKDLREEMETRTDPTSENEIITKLLYTGLKNSLTLPCTCRAIVFGVT